MKMPGGTETKCVLPIYMRVILKQFWELGSTFNNYIQNLLGSKDGLPCESPSGS